MKRRTATECPTELAWFRVEDWPAEGDTDDERHRNAARTWRSARDEWAMARGWPVGPEWWEEATRVLVETPREPFDYDAL